MKLNHTDVLVIGAGLAGQRAAIAARRRGLAVAMLSLVPARRSPPVMAQGGLRASLGNNAMVAGDNEDPHFQATVRGADWGCDQRVARMFAHMAPKAARELAAWGVPWSRERAGRREVPIHGARASLTEPAAALGLIAARDLDGSDEWRGCHAADGTGDALLHAVSEQVFAEAIPVYERVEAMALIHDGGHCQGAVVRDLITGELGAWLARATVIASGGYGRIYGVSTNALGNEGMGQALALETGVARLANMEAVQFHPTASDPAGILPGEGCRGNGQVLGIDPAREWIPVRPAQHYTMGGVRTDFRGESPWLAGLFACGEAACWDLHGFNRLDGNALAEAVVAGMLVGEYVADYCESRAARDPDAALAREFAARERGRLEALLARPGGEDALALRRRMEAIMTDRVGLLRNGPGLEAAVAELAALLERSQAVGMRTRRMDANPELVLAYRLPRMLKLALSVAVGALGRTESRGAHYREDHPARNDRDWLNRTLIHWPEGAALPETGYEALDVLAMELPPGAGGHGAAAVIPHPDAARRQAEVDEMHAAMLDRHAAQSYLMSFKQYLPARYRGRNQRLDEPLP